MRSIEERFKRGIKVSRTAGVGVWEIGIGRGDSYCYVPPAHSRTFAAFITRANAVIDSLLRVFLGEAVRRSERCEKVTLVE